MKYRDNSFFFSCNLFFRDVELVLFFEFLGLQYNVVFQILKILHDIQENKTHRF